MRKETGYMFVLLSQCFHKLQPEEISLFKHIEHVQFSGHNYTNKPLLLVLILLYFYHIV